MYFKTKCILFIGQFEHSLPVCLVYEKNNKNVAKYPLITFDTEKNNNRSYITLFQ